MHFILKNSPAAALTLTLLAAPSFANDGFHPFDSDKDGKVSLEEWLIAGEARRADLEATLAKNTPEIITANFKSVDADADGYLDAAELAAAKAARDAAQKP